MTEKDCSVPTTQACRASVRMGNTVHTLTNRRLKEACVAYEKSQDWVLLYSAFSSCSRAPETGYMMLATIVAS